MTELQLDEATLEAYEYLDQLRESGVTNMFGAGIYLEQELGLDKRETSALLAGWMQSFSERHPR